MPISFKSAIMEFWEELQPGLQPPGWVLYPRGLPCIPRMGSAFRGCWELLCSLVLLSWTKVPPGTEVLSTKLRTWPFMACVFVQKLWNFGVVVPIHRPLFLSSSGFKVDLLRFGRRWFGISLYPPAWMSPTSMVAWVGNSIILLVWNHQRKENY